MYIIHDPPIEVGQKVKHVPSGYDGTAIHVHADSQVDVKFDRTDLIPPIMKIPMHELAKIGYDVKDVCPKCGTKWIATTLFSGIVYDCLKCNMKKEEIEDEARSNKTTSTI